MSDGHGDGHDGHDHHDERGHQHDDHDHEHPPVEGVEARARAIQSLLVEQGIVSNDAIDEAITAYEEDVGPLNGARVVARAWTDPAFEDRLLEDATAAIREEGFDFEVGLDHLAVKENTEDTHNVVVCTLCSCYPWSMLGLPPTWYKTPAYRSRTVREPRSVLAEFGLELPDDVEVSVWDSSSEIRYMVLPQRPDGTENYSEDELTDLVTRNAMIGVERLGSPPVADGGSARQSTAHGTSGPVSELLASGGDRTFTAPWQARTFGVTVALYDDGDGFDWRAFQQRLIAAVEGTDLETYPDDLDPERMRSTLNASTGTENVYYEQWLDALESLLLDRRLLEQETLDARRQEFADGDRTAEEFVRGQRQH